MTALIKHGTKPPVEIELDHVYQKGEIIEYPKGTDTIRHEVVTVYHPQDQSNPTDYFMYVTRRA